MTPERNDDPITGQSMSGLIFWLTAILLLTTFWGLYDEFYSMRPWKHYQSDFARLYTRHLERVIPVRDKQETELRNSAKYQELIDAEKAASEAAATQIKATRDEIQLLDQKIQAVQAVFMVARAEVGALRYRAETAGSESGRNAWLDDVKEVKGIEHSITLPQMEGEPKTVRYAYDRMESEIASLKIRKAALTTKLVGLRAEQTRIQKEIQEYEREQLAGLNRKALDGLLDKTRSFKAGIRQIHIKDGDLVDRCESCHLGTREPVTLTSEDMGGRREFISHPEPDLLAIHDPDRFGCSGCHGGNGRATSSVDKGHGRYKHWLWPLHEKENVDAGCQQCHRRDFVLEGAETLNRGKEIFRLYGCIGCHRYDGFDNPEEQFINLRTEINQFGNRRRDMGLEIAHAEAASDIAETNAEARRLNARAEKLRLKISALDAETAVAISRSMELLKEIKKTGPSLKDLKNKVRPEWIPEWLRAPHEWRATTKMPVFRQLTEDEEQRKSVAAFIWQNSDETSIARQPRGNAARGQQAFESRGCLACHSIGEGDDLVGGRFSANLSRVGEKLNYDFLVRWIRNPRERLRPYCTEEKRDLTPEDYRRHGLRFEWDIAGDTCPNDGAPLMVMNQTVMPSLRLSLRESRDIATYLMDQKRDDFSGFPEAGYLNDPALFDRGHALVKNLGCAGCHEIGGLEDEARIGTELTFEGSKPIERLDFALQTHPAEREGWYNHKGFFKRKLENPALFDEGKVKEPGERLRMPKANLDAEGVNAITTFLLGSVTPTVPESLQYLPSEQGRDIQEGWWVLTKYNCMGCHQARMTTPSTLMGLAMYRGNKEALPPSLVGVGARLTPDWLAGFLADPALSATNTDRNGIRSYLEVRMPTFYLSAEEIHKLVRFFQALSSQPLPYVPPKQTPLTNTELQVARALFTHRQAPCLQCHAVGIPSRDRNATAPNFIEAASRLKPDWTRRWLIDPASIMPGTAMPSGLFKREGERWVFRATLPPAIRNYRGDHAELLVRYMLQLTPQEQRRLVGRGSAALPVRRESLAAAGGAD